MPKAFWINAKDRVLSVLELPPHDPERHQALNDAVGGWLECLWQFPAGDILYGNSDARLRGINYGFRLIGTPWPELVGNAILIGREIVDNNEESGYRVADVGTRFVDLGNKLVWMDTIDPMDRADVVVSSFENFDDLLDARRDIAVQARRAGMGLIPSCAECLGRQGPFHEIRSAKLVIMVCSACVQAVLDKAKDQP